MCGIAGLMTADGATPDAGVLDRLSDALAHRGPDGRGRHVANGVGLIQTRLAIIDLETGDQPIYAGDGPAAAIVANGEIYNYIELRADLPDIDFKTNSDCEPPLHLYLKHGPTFGEKLRGMYAIAVHDMANSRLVLTRDPFGIKPLYYAETPGGFVFASEPAALIAAGLITPSLNQAARDDLLGLQFTTGAETAFSGIFRMLPGETLIVKSGRISERLRRPALPEGGIDDCTEESALARLDQVLNDTVEMHQRSDVPYGMFFSGGIDSSVLLAMMRRLNEQPVRALTAGFSGTGVHDERDHARAVAKAVGADHIEVDFDAADFMALLPEIAAALDDPTADYAVLPTYKLAARARAEGLKVVLSGEGGDELFAGYARYRHAARTWPFARRMRRKGILQGLGVLRQNAPGWRDGFAASEREAMHPGGGDAPTLARTRLQVAQAVDCADWLPNDLLIKLDRCLMAHGVEGRVPFLDPAVADFAFRLPDRLKIKHRRGKWLLRRWLETGLPASKPFSRKRGFSVPVDEWIATHAQALGPLVAVQPGIAEICRPSAVESLFSGLHSGAGKRNGKAAWTLLFYALWHRAHILGHDSRGDLIDVLADKGV